MSDFRLTEPGIYDGVPMADYVADPCPEPSLTSSVIEALVARSPKHAHMIHPRLGGFSDSATSRSDLGSAAHAALLGGARIQVVESAADAKGVFKAVTDWRLADAKRQRDEIRAAGNIPLLKPTAEKIEAMMAVAKPALASLGEGRCEQTMVWRDGGVWFRSRPDWVSQDFRTVVDYKTCDNADPKTWVSKVLYRSGYHIQAARYDMGLESLKPLTEGDRNRTILFMLQEIEPPYEVSFVGIGGEELETARRYVALARELWRQCLEKQAWHGYGRSIHWAATPSYIAWDIEEREASNGQERGGR